MTPNTERERERVSKRNARLERVMREISEVR